ncbi:MAG: type II/IV secretion system protein [Armatimonadetes bacterium]|nr:type II/IV secretion system protein [Armatimonadota bacterium]
MQYTFGDLRSWLLEAGHLDRSRLDAVAGEGPELVEALDQRGLLSTGELMELLSDRMAVPYTELSGEMIEPSAVAILGEEVIRKYQVFPVLFVANILTVAMVDPQDLFVLDTLKSVSGHPINPILCSPRDLRACVDRFFGMPLALVSADEGETERPAPASLEFDDEDVTDEISVIKLVDMLMSEALKLGASDVHIEATRSRTRVRYRVDGELREVHSWPAGFREPVISRIKVLATMDITRKHLPQDGHFSLSMEGAEVDFRVATTPTERGESCVIRILEQSKGAIRLDEVGFHPADLARIHHALGLAQGFVLMTGPTGSGKTTSLYAMLNQVNSLSRKIITIEDPVEYRLDIINQIPVNHKVGLDFATGMRSVLRQDPDIILVGEIRDRETAQVAVQAALTGHLLLSTLHTNGTVETIFRLMDIGIEPFFVKEVLNCVVAQRLVRRVCPYCREEHCPSREELAPFGLDPDEAADRRFFAPRGCYFCNLAGYKGRTAVMEVLGASERLREAIGRGATSEELRRIAVEGGMRTFAENALAKVHEGITTLEEVRKVLPAGGQLPSYAAV